MAKQNVQLAAFNRGVVSKLALARVDVKRLALSAEEQTNWMPKTLGPMSLRAGMQYVGSTYNNAAARFIPFAFAVGDTALVELTSGKARFWVDDALVSFPSVSTTIANDSFATDVSSWTDADEAGATSEWATGGYLKLSTQTQGHKAKRYQQVSVAVADRGVAHALRITVAVGACLVRVGSTLGGEEYLVDTEVARGTSTLAFTPAGASFYLQIAAAGDETTWVASATLHEGVLEVSTEWTTSAQLDAVRADQSGDVIFLACNGVKQKRVERRAGGAWSVVDYIPEGGPYRTINTTPTKVLVYTDSTGARDVEVSSSQPLFKAGHVGSLFRVDIPGQYKATRVTSEEVFTEPVKVTGAGAVRALGIVVDMDGGAALTVTLQRSVGEVGGWTDVATYAVDTTTTLTDGLDNQIVYYRIGCKTAGFTSGGAAVYLEYEGGVTTTDILITDFTDATSVLGALQGAHPFDVPLNANKWTEDWYEAAWSDVRGYPSAGGIYESRLCWAGKGGVQCSVSDSYSNFDTNFIGDAGPISRTIGSGMVDTISWVKPTTRLILGGGGAEYAVRSSSQDEPITPTNFNLRAFTTRGSSGVDAVKDDQNVVFVDRSGQRVYALSPDSAGVAHVASHLTELAPEITQPSVVRMAVQRTPNPRLHCVRSDGKVAVLVFDPVEQVQAWVLVETDGEVEDVVALPNAVQDDVYYVVKRTINGATVRYLEKWAHDADCVGGTVNKQADAFVNFTNAPASTSVTGLTHLAGETCVCWADGKDFGEVTVSAGGVATLPTAAATGVIGLGYQARFKSAKLAFAAQAGAAVNQVKRVDHLGLILADTHYQGLQYGPDYTNLDDLPLVENGEATAADTVWASYDSDSVEFNGEYDTDSRICLVANAPRPCTVVSAVISMQTNEKL